MGAKGREEGRPENDLLKERKCWRDFQDIFLSSVKCFKAFPFIRFAVVFCSIKKFSI